jgi:signal transduction histidine kinase
MDLRSKIWAAMAAAGVVPLVLLGWLSYRTSRTELTDTVGRLQAETAAELARGCERVVEAGAASVALAAGYVPWSGLSREEVAAVLAIPYRQLADVAALALVDAQGEAVVPPLFEPHPERYPELAGREPVAEAELELFARSIPLKAALEAGVAVGPPHRPEGRGPRVAVAARLSDGRVLAAELSMAELQRRLDALALEGQIALLLDARGVPVTRGGGAAGTLEPNRSAEGRSSSGPLVWGLEPQERALVDEGKSTGRPTARAIHRGGVSWLAAYAPMPRLGWGVVLAQPAKKAFRAADRVRDYTLLWAGLATGLTLVLGALLARGLSRPIAALSQATAAAARGVFAPMRSTGGHDEVAQLANAFNHMIDGIQRRDAALLEFNLELQQRVEARTAELRLAQNQILRTRRLTALGSLGAGVAHELNNPLTALLGHLTLARRSLAADGDAAISLREAHAQAKRMARIVQDLSQFTTQEQAGAGQRFALARPVRAALDALAEPLRAAQVELVADLPEPSPQVQGNYEQIEKLVTHLVRNALNAMPHGGPLEVGAREVEGEAVKLWVKDAGKGIPAELRERIFDPFFSTKESPGQVGLGLSICHAIAEAHHGTIRVESEVGKGSTFTVVLPAAASGGHLV